MNLPGGSPPSIWLSCARRKYQNQGICEHAAGRVPWAISGRDVAESSLSWGRFYDVSLGKRRSWQTERLRPIRKPPLNVSYRLPLETQGKAGRSLTFCLLGGTLRSAGGSTSRIYGGETLRLPPI